MYSILLNELRFDQHCVMYQKKSIPSKESDTKDLTEYIVRLRSRHHQLLLFWNKWYALTIRGAQVVQAEPYQPHSISPNWGRPLSQWAQNSSPVTT